MRLLQSQIDALASKFTDELKEKNAKLQKEHYAKQDSLNLKKAEELEKIISSMPKELYKVFYDLRYRLDSGKKVITKTAILESLRSSFPSFNQYDEKDKIKNDIIIASINCKDIEEIEKRLKIKINIC